MIIKNKYLYFDVICKKMKQSREKQGMMLTELGRESSKLMLLPKDIKAVISKI